MWNIPSEMRLARIPRLYETEDVPLEYKYIHLHFFIFGSDWFIAEYDGNDLFFGYVILNNDLINSEWGFFSFQELREINIKGFEIDCENEFGWKVKKAIEIDKICIANNWERSGSCTIHQ